MGDESDNRSAKDLIGAALALGKGAVQVDETSSDPKPTPEGPAITTTSRASKRAVRRPFFIVRGGFDSTVSG